MNRSARLAAGRRILPALLALVGSWKFWCATALAAGAAAISIVIYNQIYADPSDKGNFGYQTLGRERVLLMNVDKNTACPVTYESYVYNQTQAAPDRRSYEAYWTFVEKDTVSLYNLKANFHTELHVSNNGQPGDRLWSLLNCRHGNTHSSDANVQKISNYLPFSSTSYGISKTSTAASNIATADTAGQIVFQNVPEAQVVSSCYPEGIGTVYFDAVNGFTGYLKGQLEVDVAYGVFKTNITGQVESRRIPEDLERDADGNLIPPDDAHCDEVRFIEQTETTETTETTPFGRLAWVRANLTGVKNLNGTVTTLPTNDVITLDIATGNSSENFFRLWAPVSDAVANPGLADLARGPMRFRIKRVDNPKDTYPSITPDGKERKTAGLQYEKQNGLLLVDNVIASYPAMKAWAIPQGEYVPAGKRNVIGWTGAVTPVKYPAVGETGLKAAAGLAFATNNPPGVTADWIDSLSASMTYRWRYMDQVIEAWKKVALKAQDGGLVSDGEFEIPSFIGDVEFKYDVELDAPYYDYVDYSGSTKLSGTPRYIERIKQITSALNPAAIGTGGIPRPLPSGGTDFFFRLRAGKSYFDQLEWQLEVRQQGGTACRTNALWIVSDGTWKTFLRTTTNETSETALTVGDWEFRVIGLDPAKVFGGNDVTELPWNGKPLYPASNGQGWTKIHVDAVTGALMFQVTENKESADYLTYSIVRGDAQDFAYWSDAVVSGGLYTGAFIEGRGKQSGSSADARQYPGELGAWHPNVSSNATYWVEKFTCSPNETPDQGYGGYKAYEPFEKKLRTPNGWGTWNGTWVCGKWRESAKGGNMALQLGGDGGGNLEFDSSVRAPLGVDTVTLDARIAQTRPFEDFAYAFGGALSAMKDYVFTIRTVMSTTAADTEFEGNGSVSLVGYYQPGVGCYELRAERIADDTIRLYLYKWLREKRTVTATLLGYNNTSIKFKTESYLRASNAAQTSDDQSSAYFGELFMRCRTVSGKAEITIGVMNAAKTIAGDTSGTAHLCMIYRDTTANNPLTFGSYGFGSVNCPAQFTKPRFYSNGGGSAGFPTLTGLTGKPKDRDGKDITSDDFRAGPATTTVTYPSGGVDAYKAVSGEGYQDWSMNPGVFARATIAGERSAKSVAPEGELELFTWPADGSSEDETSRGTVPLSGFRTKACSFAVHNHERTLLRISTTDGSDDVVVDNVSFGQWCASSYNDMDSSGRFVNEDFKNKTPGFACPTNWVYMNGWVSVNGETHEIDLQPARVKGRGLLEVRAPLMDGLDGRGIGLGQFSFNYRNADEHCVLKVQYAPVNGAPALPDATESTANWIDVSNIVFSAMTAAERKNDAGKPITVYVGQHGFKGTMRILVDPDVVNKVVDNPALGEDYGRITITDFSCTDEPPLDGRSWWGWNIRTTRDAKERSLDDSLDTQPGLAAALNCSTTELTEPIPDESAAAREKRFAQHVPFVQSPTFGTNIVGEISFKARKLSPDDPPTEVAVLGAKDGAVGDDLGWECLSVILVTNAVFSETYSYKTRMGNDYASFRLAVIGVKGVSRNYADRMLPEVPTPRRVLIDDVMISEAVRGKVAFENVGAFRNPLDTHTYVTNLFDIVQQPMCEESWSVQCEIYASQLMEEIDLSSAEVTFHWYRGDKWGYAKWADDPAAKSAKLARIRNQPGYAFRGSYAEASGAIVDPIYDSGAVVQYMLEVSYRTTDNEKVTQLLTSGEWKKPAWYRGIDYNAQNGGFAAYTILDTVAYGYAWINEVNVYDGPNPDSDISSTNQFIEIAMPEQANISGWRLEFVTGGLSENPDAVLYTNVVATFTDDPQFWSPGLVPSTKDVQYMDEDSTYVFLAVGNKASASSEMMADHRIDGVWAVNENESIGEQVNRSTGYIDCGMPIGIRLVRPSGLVEHEIVVAGTNRWDFYGPPYTEIYSQANYLARMNRYDPDRSWTAPCLDSAFPQNYGISVTNGTSVATDVSVWAHWPKTPGRVNMCNGVKEYIESDYPRPQGSKVRLYAQLQGGYINQSIGEFVATVSNVVLWVEKGAPDGTNIVYQITNCWYELESLVETSSDWTREHTDKIGSRGAFSVPVAVYASNDVKVVAKTRVRADIDALLGPDNDYREAVLKWLEAGKWGPRSNRRDFKNPGEIHQAMFVGLSGSTNRLLRLTEMYWLDLDPTVAGTVFQAGMCDPPQPVDVERAFADRPHIGPGEGTVVTNDVCEDIILGVFMKIWNENGEFAPYAPYTLNGIKPGQTTMDHPAGWDSVTFKITGYLQNGMDATKDPDKIWMPLRYFVFDEGSFGADFKAKIQVEDPFVQFAEWKKYFRCPVYFRWDLDTRKFGAVGNDLLRPDSTFK